MSNEAIRRSKRVRDLRIKQDQLQLIDEPDGPRRKKAPRPSELSVDCDRISLKAARQLGRRYKGCMNCWGPDVRNEWDQTRQMYDGMRDNYNARAMFSSLCGSLARHETQDSVKIDSRGMGPGAFAKFLDLLDHAGFNYVVGGKDLGHGLFATGCKQCEKFREIQFKWCVHFTPTKTIETASS